MKKILLASVAALIAMPALAADLPRRAPAVAPAPSYAPIFTWTGFYVGAQAGYGWGKHKIVDTGFAFDTKGVLGGLHAGYNWQSGALVYGAEADLEYGNVTEKVTFEDATGVASTKARGSARIRVGYAFDRALIYATGGAAAAWNKWSFTDGVDFASVSKTKVGWTAGAGFEYALTNNWSTRLEYRYMDLGSVNRGVGNSKAKVAEHAVRVGVSYRFGGSAGPILARY